MFFRILSSFILMFVLTACSTPPKPLRVLTYNIHHGEGTHGRLDLERIAAVIKSADPDLAAIQEVDNKTSRTGNIDQAAELGKLTGMHVVFGAAMPYMGGEYGQALLSKWPLTSNQVHRLPGSALLEPRIAVSAVVEPEGRGKILFIGTHLDHTSTITNRVQQAARLNELFSTGQSMPVILCGDFNAVRESKSIELLLSHWEDAAGVKASPTIPAGNPKRRIDYIFFGPKEQFRVLETKVLEEPVASDHRPVLGVLE